MASRSGQAGMVPQEAGCSNQLTCTHRCKVQPDCDSANDRSLCLFTAPPEPLAALAGPAQGGSRGMKLQPVAGVWTRRRAGYSGLHVLQEGLQQLHQVGHRVRRQMQAVRVPHAASEAGRSSAYITSPGPAPGCWQPFKKAAASSERESANWRIASERDAAKRRAPAVCAWRAPRTWRT